MYCLAEEFGEAIKVGNLLGSLDLTVEGDVSKPLLFFIIITFDHLTFSIQPYNPYVEDLHIKLSKPVHVQDEAMDTSISSQVQNYYPLFTIDCGYSYNAGSFGKVLHLCIAHCMVVYGCIDNSEVQSVGIVLSCFFFFFVFYAELHF